MSAQLTPRTRIAALATAAAASLLATAMPAAADDAPNAIHLPAGEACTDFPVTLVIGDDSKRTTRGDLTTGRAESVVVTNDETGESVTVPSRGARTLVTTNEGITTVTSNGNLLLVLFSTDVGGAGLEPSSTTLIAGRTVITVDKKGVYTVESVNGKTTDICAALAAP